MSRFISNKARLCIQQSLRALHRYIRTEFIGKPSSKRNLQSGLLAQGLFHFAKRAALSEIDLWRALFDLCLIQGRSWERLELPEGIYFNLSWPLLWHLERINPEEGESYKFVWGLNLWANFFDGLSRSQKRAHIRRFCDWIEAEIALFAYQLYKANKNCFQEDDFASFVNILVERLNLAEKTFTSGERDRVFSQTVSELKLDYNQSSPIWDVAKLYQPAPSNWEYKELDCWLFQIWPFVKHFDWTMKELSTVIEKKKEARPNGRFASLDLNSYPCHPDSIGQHLRIAVGLKHEDRPRGQPKVRLDGDGRMPPRGRIAILL